MIDVDEMKFPKLEAKQRAERRERYHAAAIKADRAMCIPGDSSLPGGSIGEAMAGEHFLGGYQFWRRNVAPRRRANWTPKPKPPIPEYDYAEDDLSDLL